VIGVPDELLGEAIEAYVVPRDGAAPDAQAILRHCHQKLAKFKLPRAVHFVERLPKNSFGKVIKAELKQAPPPA
jgi:acyl-coenzyme A synthetase/AMP-(fatty) acid ligase